MKKIDFQHYTIYTGIAHNQKRVGDARESMANLFYEGANGIKAHALAFKIYRSEGATEYTDEEVRMITTMVETRCTPSFIDGLREQLGKTDKV